MEPLVTNKLVRAGVGGLIVLAGMACTIWAWQQGKHSAYSEVTVHNAGQLSLALDYFFADQDRFPTAAEFASSAIMGSYISRMPLYDKPGKGCSESFAYRRVSPQSYQLSLCLPAGAENYPKGWSEVVK